MEFFYSQDIGLGNLRLDEQESRHCVKVLRHVDGDRISIIDGKGCRYVCTITDADPHGVGFSIDEVNQGYGCHNYFLHMAVAPPKNPDRFEWFCEKATEIGLDEITPLFGEFSERKVFKSDRPERILISAAKQSQKGAIPVLNEPSKVMDFIHQEREGCLMICYCGEVESVGASKLTISEVMASNSEEKYTIMIGPEGDFSPSEIAEAVRYGWQPVTLGNSRLRIETAALVATTAVYLNNLTTETVF